MITHLMFADDCMLFVKAKQSSVGWIRDILKRYEAVSGQKINYTKSEGVCSRNVPDNFKQNARDCLQIRIVDSHSQYLGLPLLFGSKKVSLFRSLEEKTLRRISDWKHKLLSCAGREAIPQYATSCFKIPTSVCKKLASYILRFWWHGSEAKGINWLKAKEVYKEKEAGGLGLRDLEQLNLALLAKQGWRILTKPNLLVSKIFKANSEWDDRDRKYHWKFDGSGDLTVKSAYQVAIRLESQGNCYEGEPSDTGELKKFWQSFWKLQIPNRVKIFGWRLYHDGLPTAQNLARRGCDVENFCWRCGKGGEDSIHLFKDCWWSRSLLQAFNLPVGIWGNQCPSPGYWIWLSAKIYSREEFVTLLGGLWLWWKDRNEMVHGGDGSDIPLLQLRLRGMLNEWKAGARRHLWWNMQGGRDEAEPVIQCDGSFDQASRMAGAGAVFIEQGSVGGVKAVWAENVSSVLVAKCRTIRLGMELAIELNLPKTVYKGRKKKTIEYFAIKSVDKSQKSKVLQEVRILHALDHPNVLHFYSWYETSAHLWLVLEYCVGGDLMTLLRQDNQLPEESVHTLACDLVKALQFLHSKGIIYCDLKPSNILLDENGHTKLCDFGLARKLGDISKTSSSSLPQAKRGTPCYMAPELFQDGGVHSFASDFWALGCVLFECYAGRPPFVGKEFTQLVRSVLSDPTPPLPGSPSCPFANLINSLLIKDPAERLQWVELCDHTFWTIKFTPIPLPPQPAFTNMIELNSKPCLSKRNSNKPLHDRTPPRSREKDTKGTPRRDENSGLRGYSTPGSRKTQTKTSGRVDEEKQREPSSASNTINLLRLSRIAKSNLQRENEKENYRRPLANDCENDSEVKIENTDMELDFNENAEDDAQEVEDTEGQDSQNSPLGVQLPSQTRDTEKPDTDAYTNQTGPPPTVDFSEIEDSKPGESSIENNEVAVTPTASPQMKNPKASEASGFKAGCDASKPSDFLGLSLWHPSDLSVRPVMPSRKTDKVSDVVPSLPFEMVPPSDFVKMPKEQLNSLNSKIASILHANTSTMEKQNVVRHLEMLSTNGDAANILTNGPIMLLLVKLLRQSKVSALRVQIASLIGLLVRHSTFIEYDLAHSGIIGSLTDGLRDRQEKVRRFSMAALGELLFYISTQDEQAKDNNPPESPSKDSRSAAGWQVSNALISLVSSVLRKGEDDLTQLYALRTIENMCSQGSYWATRFSSQDVVNNLCYIYKAVGKPENMRLTAGSCLVRLARFNPPIIQAVFGKLSFKDIALCIAKGSCKEQQISLNLMIMALLESHLFTNIGRCLMPLVEDKNVVPSLLSLIEQGSEILRGKALVFISLLCKNGRRWLQLFFCNARLLSAADRLTKEKDGYVQQCLEAFVHVVASTVPGLLEIINGDIQQMMSGRRHGLNAGFARSTSKSNVHLFPVVLHLLGSLCFKHRVLNQEVLQQLTTIINLAESSFQGRDEFQLTLLQILESITEDPSAIQLNPYVYIHNLLPSLAVLYKGNKDGNARFLCLKILFDVMVNFLDEPLEPGQRSDDLKSIATQHFLPLYPTLVDDDDPIPMYAQKLLVMLIEFNFIKISDILHKKTVSQCFEFLLGDLSTANVNNVKLCLALTSALEMENKVLSQLKVVRRIGNLLEFVKAKDMEDFLEPTLQLCMAFLLRSVNNRKGYVYSKEPTLLSEGSCKMYNAVDEQQCIRDIHDLASNVGVLLELSGSQEANIADMGSECIVLLLAAAPREATTNLLFNLPKVTSIFQSLSRGSFDLPLRRMLHALGYSCRQYLSHAMILSFSVTEISRIESIVRQLKSSSNPGTANAASIVALELQRMPRYN
ncbi:hypothetical protein QQ045_028206 [Rhodiola kirilowii]